MARFSPLPATAPATACARAGLRRGFPLVEIMVVVVIIGVLAAMGLPAFQRVKLSAVSKRYLNDARQVRDGAERHALENGNWAAPGVRAGRPGGAAGLESGLLAAQKPAIDVDMSYTPAEQRYASMTYSYCGKSGLKLPALSLGLWHNFGGAAPTENARAMCRRAFDLGITHFDLANNYGPPPGSAESNFGEILRSDFAGLRDELVVSTKAGYRMWPGPYGEWGSRKYLLSSLDQSLKRMGLDYVDIFYSHRFDPKTPLEETMGALDQALRSGKALYVGISSYNSRRTQEANALLREFGQRCLIHQPSYSMLNRWVETDGLFDTLAEEGMGCIAFSPLAQGMLTDKYLAGQPADSRAKSSTTLRSNFLSPENLANIRALNDIARSRGQSLAQMAIAWVLRDPRVTTALIGASKVSQIEDCVAALKNTDFSGDELERIDHYARDAGINLWAASSAG